MTLRRSVLFFLTPVLFTSSAFAAIVGTVVNPDGQPVAGAKVSSFAPETIEARRLRLVSKSPERVPLASVTTDSNGRFTVDDKKESVVDVRVEAKGFAPTSARYATDEDAGAIALTVAAMKTGTITANGKPVAGATVVWSGDAEVIATTDEKGKYSVPDPDKWANRLTVIHADYAPLDEGMAPFGDSRKNVDRTLAAGVALSGRVVAADGTTAVPKVPIFVDNWPMATSGDDGAFTIPHAGKDWAQVEARVGDRAAARARMTGAINLKLTKGGVISGVVRDVKTNQPLAGAELRLTSGTGPFAAASRVAFSDAKGNYTLSPMVAGNYQLNATRPGFNAPPVAIAVPPGQAVQKPVYLSERARVSGSVVDEEKRPVGGTRLTARPAGREGGLMMIGRGQQAATAVSAPDGRFVLRGADTGADLQLEAQKRGLPVAKSATLKLNPGERKTGVTITIPRGLTLSGKVTDKDGKPLSGVAVDAAESGGDMGAMMVRRVMISTGRANEDQIVRTGSDGTFSMKLKEGSYDLNFKREGFAAKNVRAHAVNATAKPLEITLDPGVEISGRITRSGAGVDGVNVSAIGQDGVTTTQSAPDGTFRLADLTPGSMMLSVNRPEAFVQTMRSVTAPARDVNIELPAGGRITGRVVDKTTHQPLTSFQAGVTMPRGGGGMVMVMPPMLRNFTSDDGSFTLENVPPGQVELLANAPGYTTGRMPALNVEDGKTLANIEIGLETGVKLTGRVTGPDGGALSGVTVRADNMAGGGRMMRVQAGGGAESSGLTDPNGEYSIDSLEPGEKTFNFTRSGYLTESKTVNLSGKETRLDVTLSTGMRVTGTVTSEAGGPIADASVSAGGSDFFGGRAVRTDASGAFQMEGLAPGHYTFTASKSGYANGISRDVDISSGAPVRLIMKSGGIITGHVLGLTERELPETTVMANGANGNANAPVDSNGNFRIEGTPTGTVRVSARTGGPMMGAGAKSSPTKSVDVEPGGTATVDLEFKSSTVIRGRVTRNRAPLTGAMVLFMPKSGRATTNSSATTDSSGNYELNGLDDAPYNVQVIDMERVTPFTTSYEVKGSGNFDIDITTSSVRGRVLDATTGQPVLDAHVEIKAAGTESFFTARGTQTDSGGNFLLEQVGRGNYTATVDKSGYGHETKDFNVGDSDPQLEFKIAPSSGVTLRVVDARDQRQLVANARVVDAQGHDIDAPLFRNSAEPIKLTLAPGTYRITVTANGYSTRTLIVNAPSEQTVAMSPGGTLVIHSKSGTAMRARLIDAMGTPYTRGPFANPIFMLDPSPGSTTLNNVGAGTYRLELLDNSDKVVSATTVTVVEGQVSEAAI